MSSAPPRPRRSPLLRPSPCRPLAPSSPCALCTISARSLMPSPREPAPARSRLRARGARARGDRARRGEVGGVLRAAAWVFDVMLLAPMCVLALLHLPSLGWHTLRVGPGGRMRVGCLGVFNLTQCSAVCKGSYAA